MPGEGARPYATVRRSGTVAYQIWLLRFSPCYFSPLLRSWRFLLPSLRWRLIVTLPGGNRARLFPRLVDARFYRTRSGAEYGVGEVTRRLQGGHRPWKGKPDPSLAFVAGQWLARRRRRSRS
jgi:hypothetical protein